MLTALLAAMLFASEGPPLPWDTMLTPALATGASTNAPVVPAANGADTNAPAVPMHFRATLVKNMLMRWQPAYDTNTTFLVFKSTNLVAWTTFTNLPYNVSSVLIETPWDTRGFFILGRSNKATGLRFK